jgi:hypothetical protein
MTTVCISGDAAKGTLTGGRRTTAPLWPWIVVTAWLASAALGFWFFQLRDTRSFESDSVTLFDAKARAASAEAWFRSNLSADAGNVAATVVHIYRAGCACNRFTEPHLAKIAARYRQEGVRFVVATREQSTAYESAMHPVSPIDGLPQYAITDNPDLDWLATAPAALVYDSAGKLVYFGPYSDAAWCGASGGLVERILDRLLAGQTPRLQPFYGSGCFCPTRT